MKTFTLFLLVINLITNIYSYEIENKWYPYSRNNKKTVYKTDGYNNGRIYSEDECVDYKESVANFMKENFPSVEYRITSANKEMYSNYISVSISQLYNGVDVESASLYLRVRCETGEIYESTENIIPDISAINFVDRGSDLESAKHMLEIMNEKFYNDELDLSKATFKDNREEETDAYIMDNVPFDVTTVKKEYLEYICFDENDICRGETSFNRYLKPTWHFHIEIGNTNNFHIFFDDSNDEVLYMHYSTISIFEDRSNVFKEIDFEDLLVKKNITSGVKTIPKKTTTTAKAIPITKAIPTTTTTSSKAIPITTTTSTKAIPTTTTTSTKAIPTTTTTSTKAIPTTTTTSTKAIPTTTTTSTKAIPTTTTTSTKAIPTTTTTSTKAIPTTTTTSTKTIPTSTTTSTKTIPTSTCKNITITVTQKETITVKETVTVTVNGGSTPTENPSQNCAAKWAQCGGQGFNGPTCCQSGSTCREINQYYSQCL